MIFRLLRCRPLSISNLCRLVLRRRGGALGKTRYRSTLGDCLWAWSEEHPLRNFCGIVFESGGWCWWRTWQSYLVETDFADRQWIPSGFVAALKHCCPLRKMVVFVFGGLAFVRDGSD